MIVQCRPSHSPPKWKVKWIVRKKYGIKEIHERIKNNFADANGLALGLQKRGIFVFPLEEI